jgi:hypothetical protein
MPLIKGKSPEAFKSNLKAELSAGKPMKQSLAIAYAVKRKAKKMASGGVVTDYSTVPLKKPATDQNGHPIRTSYADGGFVEEEDASGMEPHEGNDVKMNHAAMEEDDRDLGQHGAEEVGPYGAYAMGGLVDDDSMGDEMDRDMVGRIMAQRRMMYSRGGQVSNDVGVAEADKLPAEYDDLVLRDDDMEDADYTGANSGDEIGGNDEEKRRRDVVAMIMRSRAKKDRMPNPA